MSKRHSPAFEAAREALQETYFCETGRIMDDALAVRMLEDAIEVLIRKASSPQSMIAVPAGASRTEGATA